MKQATVKPLLYRVWLPQIVLAGLLAAGLTVGLGLTIIYHRAWITPPSIGIVYGPHAYNSEPLQQQLNKR